MEAPRYSNLVHRGSIVACPSGAVHVMQASRLSGTVIIAYNIHCPTRITSFDLLQACWADTTKPAPPLSETAVTAGYIIRCEEYCPHPVHQVLIRKPTQPLRRDQGNKITYTLTGCWKTPAYQNKSLRCGTWKLLPSIMLSGNSVSIHV